MEGYLTNKKFLLNHDFAQEAFVKLLKEKEIIREEELLKEIEKLMIEHIRKQITKQI
jgi:hypothetical protein